jgi:hypothetical protein
MLTCDKQDSQQDCGQQETLLTRHPGDNCDACPLQLFIKTGSSRKQGDSPTDGRVQLETGSRHGENKRIATRQLLYAKQKKR